MPGDNLSRVDLLEKALEEIEALAAPRRIDIVSELVGIDMVEFASLRPAKMRAVVLATLKLSKIAHSRGEVASQKIAQLPDGIAGAHTRRSRD